jgi:hypothetical protein
VLCVESNPSDPRESVIGRKVELKAKITDLTVIICGVVHVKVNLSPLVFLPSLRVSASPRL